MLIFIVFFCSTPPRESNECKRHFAEFLLRAERNHSLACTIYRDKFFDPIARSITVESFHPSLFVPGTRVSQKNVMHREIKIKFCQPTWRTSASIEFPVEIDIPSSKRYMCHMFSCCSAQIGLSNGWRSGKSSRRYSTEWFIVHEGRLMTNSFKTSLFSRSPWNRDISLFPFFLS